MNFLEKAKIVSRATSRQFFPDAPLTNVRKPSKWRSPRFFICSIEGPKDLGL